MQKLKFKIAIDASEKKVWDTLWSDSTYGKWTSAFTEGSYVVTDWKEGSKISFFSPSGDGLHSVIEKLERNRRMVFRHLGMVKDGKELPPDPKSEDWSGARESYTLIKDNQLTILEVDLDAREADAEYFNRTFPVALLKVKNLAEA
jgi:hypothetical protein